MWKSSRSSMEVVVSYNMKYLVLLFVCVLINNSTQQNPHDAASKAIIKQCIQESKVDPEVQRKAFMEGDFADDQNFKCYLRCVFLKTGAMKASGEFIPDVMQSLSDPRVDQEKLSEIIDKCGKSVSIDLCQKAYDISKCIFTETSKVFGG